HEIDDEFQLVEALKIGHFRLVTGFNQRFVSGEHQGRKAAAKNGLFAEEIRFGFLFEGSFDDAGAGPANTLGPGERDLFGLLAGILVNSDERRDAFALGELAADDVAGAFRRHQDYIDILRGDYRFEMDRKPVREEE